MLGKVGAVLAPLGIGLLAVALLGAGGANAVTDVAPPSLTLPAAATTNATSSRGAFVSFIAVATDDVQPTSLSCAPASGARFAVGTTTVTCTATDAASHSTSATFTITVLSAAEQLALLRTAVIALHIDPIVEQGLLDKLDSAKRSIQAGQSKNACNQLDAFANQVRAQTNKAIADGTNLLRRQNEIEAALDCVPSKAAPVLLGPRANLTTNTAPGLPTATVRYTGPSCDPASPGVFGLGTTTVRCQATDANGTTRVSFTVTVVDRESPVLTVPADITVNAPPGSSTAVVTFIVTATDNVGVRSTVCTPASGTAFAHGVTTVSCIATDTSGNTATGTFKVTVNLATTANSISGRVTDSAHPGVGVPDVGVMAQPNFGCCFASTTTGPDGRYSLDDLTPGTYRVSFFSPLGSDYLEQWWNGKPGFSAADLLTVPSTTVDLSSINAVLIHGIPVRGTVTAAVGGAAIGQVGVVATLDDPAVPCCVNYQALTAADGTYTMYVRAGHYRINFQPPSTTNYVSEYWDGKPDFGTATVVDIAAPTSNVDATLDRGFRITGRVTDAVGGGAVQNAVITIGPEVCCGAGGFAVTGPDGTYSATVREGTYKVGFNPPFGSDFVLQYWNNKPNFAAGDPLLVNADKPNIDAALAHGFRVSGRVFDAADPTIPLTGANVSAVTAAGFQFIANTAAGSDGSYSLFLPAGDYIISFNGPFLSDYGFEYWNDKTDQALADVLHVTAPMTDINAGLARSFRISGRVTDGAGQPVAGLFVNVFRPALPFYFVAGATTDGDGRYSVLVPAGSYKVLFPNNGGPFLAEWWNDKGSFETATTIDVAASVGGIDAVLARGIVISGHIRTSDGTPLAGAIANLSDGTTTCCTFATGRLTPADGSYSFTVAPGTYFVGFFADGYAFQYWNGKTDPSAADALTGAVDHPNIDAALVHIP